MHYMGHNKEPKSKSGHKGGKQPPAHSHSAKPKSKITPKRSGRKPF